MKHWGSLTLWSVFKSNCPRLFATQNQCKMNKSTQPLLSRTLLKNLPCMEFANNQTSYSTYYSLFWERLNETHSEIQSVLLNHTHYIYDQPLIDTSQEQCILWAAIFTAIYILFAFIRACVVPKYSTCPIKHAQVLSICIAHRSIKLKWFILVYYI